MINLEQLFSIENLQVTENKKALSLLVEFDVFKSIYLLLGKITEEEFYYYCKHKCLDYSLLQHIEGGKDENDLIFSFDLPKESWIFEDSITLMLVKRNITDTKSLLEVIVNSNNFSFYPGKYFYKLISSLCGDLIMNLISSKYYNSKLKEQNQYYKEYREFYENV